MADRHKTIESRCLIIAEIGVNHDGKIEKARELVDIAKETGADFVKFQHFYADRLTSRHGQLARYQSVQNANNDPNQQSLLRRLELSFSELERLVDYSRRIGIKPLISPFHESAADDCVLLGSELLKVPSGEITNWPFLRYLGSLGLDLIVSTGMSNLEEVRSAIKQIVLGGLEERKITLLHCTSVYPCPYSQVNLNAMSTLRTEFNLRVGYSDHTLGSEVSVAAVANGAQVIEKHLTYDKTAIGPDHASSLDGPEFSEMVRNIRNVELALGSFEKKPTIDEIDTIDAVRKSLVASGVIKKGEELTFRNVTVKRPGTGISPSRLDEMLGKSAKRSYRDGDLICDD